MHASPDRRILLADADAFFVAVARQVDPDGAGRAELLIVGGRPGSRGVVCSASYAARAFGVRSGMSITQALRLCPQAMAVPVPRRACSEASRAIRAALERFTPVVVAASIDEFYCDLTGTEALYRGETLAATAHRMRAAVIADTGLSVSIGGGTSRLIAKIAAGAAKPNAGADGVHIVPAGGEERFMRTQPLAEIPGIGPRAQEKLRRLGLVRVPDVLDADPATIERYLGRDFARWLDRKARGIDDSAVSPHERQKSVSREDTFDRDIADDEALAVELQRLVVRVVGDLRGDGLRARTVTVKLRENDFSTRLAARTLAEPVSTERPILAAARALLARLRGVRRRPVRLLGVALSSLDDGDVPEQLALLADGGDPVQETDRDRALAAALDRVRGRFGAGALRPASLLGDAAPASVEDRTETDGGAGRAPR
ncbi:MAG: DNA polymerase IV [Gemmatimonadaceae bacterium]|jgi:DNA polymerase-4|nr:DNA polymerase IV [Gemmatimonadaceae bacterium]